MQPVCGIYKIQNKYDGKCYIGRSINILGRWQQHIEQGYETTELEDYFHFELVHHTDYFTFDILEVCGESELDEKEKYWIDQFNSIKDGYNKVQAAVINSTNVKKKVLTQKQIVDKINSLIGKPLTKSDKAALVDFFDLRDTNGRQRKWPSIKKMIINNGLSVIETKRKDKNGQLINCSIISIDWK
jgi:group I intron endonuclease